MKQQPCANCAHFRPPDFCIYLPWNDTTLPSPWWKYQAWQHKPCPRKEEPHFALP